MPLQKFSLDHIQYDYIWNWEMETRSTGDYLDILKKLESKLLIAILVESLKIKSPSEYARHEPSTDMSSYQNWTIRNGKEEIYSTSGHMEDQEADLITLNPIFNPHDSGWYWTYDVQSKLSSSLKILYDVSDHILDFPTDTPVRASIGRNVRLSRRLLQAMNEANAEYKRSMHCESWPTSLVFHSNLRNGTFPLKGVYVPHPVYTTHVWPSQDLATRINRQDLYNKKNEKVLRDVSYYYDGGHAKKIYEGWSQFHNVCRAPALLHPVL